MISTAVWRIREALSVLTKKKKTLAASEQELFMYDDWEDIGNEVLTN
ncbi:hypothetical protein [Chryseobacterium taklimakanense]|uniref:Uncharacterized protein n=1 Tax=Chryseobacterium taklimakanense TaxID=536441 RepID=A0A239XPE3_9FLAO|nr:hypothetical protein [Chryseobacterium taklimakanense]SNV47904.1 Uncharacterised protein [Chryseobacterium taklimakanense]